MYRISPLNEAALLISFGNMIDEPVNNQVIRLHEAISKTPFAGFIESVPAYASMAVFYDVVRVKKNCLQYQTAHDWVCQYVEKLITEEQDKPVIEERDIVFIPVCYNGDDLKDLAIAHQLSVEEVISYHTGKTYRVFMIGFLPGFAYMGSVDERIAAPRHSQPRVNVKPGSVGIAGLQTGIYPVASPGGWQLVGQTPLKIFDTSRQQPCLLRAGDRVRFTSISKEEFNKLNEY